MGLLNVNKIPNGMNKNKSSTNTGANSKNNNNSEFQCQLNDAISKLKKSKKK